jgi:arginase
MQNRFILSPSFHDEPLLELELLSKSDWFINKPFLPSGDQQTRMSAIHSPIADFVAVTIKKGDRPVSIAGDCCTAIGIMAGVQRAGINPTLIWFDAHGDFNTWETTPSGFLGGMPLAMMVGRGEQRMLDAVGLEPIPEAQVILIEARDLDPGESKAVQESAVVHLNNSLALLNYPIPKSPLYVHFDVDVINPDDAPAVKYPAVGGPSASELHSVFRRLAQTGQLVAVSVSTWVPELDRDGKSQKVSMELLRTLINYHK